MTGIMRSGILLAVELQIQDTEHFSNHFFTECLWRITNKHYLQFTLVSLPWKLTKDGTPKFLPLNYKSQFPLECFRNWHIRSDLASGLHWEGTPQFYLQCFPYNWKQRQQHSPPCTECQMLSWDWPSSQAGISNTSVFWVSRFKKSENGNWLII